MQIISLRSKLCVVMKMCKCGKMEKQGKCCGTGKIGKNKTAKNQDAAQNELHETS